jgi:MULE transposase domain
MVFATYDTYTTWVYLAIVPIDCLMCIRHYIYICMCACVQNNWPMTAIGSCDENGNFIPLAHMLCSGSGQENFEQFISQFKGATGSNIPASITFITDKCDPERLAIKAIMPDARVRLCYWHFMEAIRRWLVKATNGVNDKADQLLVKDVRV